MAKNIEIEIKLMDKRYITVKIEKAVYESFRTPLNKFFQDDEKPYFDYDKYKKQVGSCENVINLTLPNLKSDDQKPYKDYLKKLEPEFKEFSKNHSFLPDSEQVVEKTKFVLEYIKGIN